MKYGMSVDEINELTGIDPWFLDNLGEIVEMEEELRKIGGLAEVSDGKLRQAKQFGFSDRQLATIWDATEMDVRREASGAGSWRRSNRSIPARPSSRPTRRTSTSTYEDEDETPPKKPEKRRIMILGGGPNRIGQGIEFDYCCCHASFALRELGIELIMVNSNPETVSTDYDTSDLLFFEPLTTEDVLNIFDRVQPDGVIVQFGGQTPLNLARALANANVPIIGTSVDTIEDAEDRERFSQFPQSPGSQAAGKRDRAQPCAGADGSGQDRLPGAGAPEFRARGPRDGDLLRRHAVRALRARGIRGIRRPAGPDRSVSRGRHRGGR